MPRIRTIKPEFFTSLTIADLHLTARLTFIGLWTHADDAGRCVDDPRLIKAAIWPLDDRTASDVEDDLKALSESSLILRYTLNQKRYLAITNWGEHQKINRPTASKIPPPDEGEPTPDPDPTSANEDSRTPHGGSSEPSRPERKGKEQGKEQGKEEDSEPAASEEPLRADVERVCRHLADVMERTGSKRPRIAAKWRNDARLLLDVDKVTVEQAIAAIDWAHASDFWQAHILSPGKLRAKYDTLRRQATAEQRKSGPSRPPTAPRDTSTMTPEEKQRALQF